MSAFGPTPLPADALYVWSPSNCRHCLLSPVKLSSLHLMSTELDEFFWQYKLPAPVAIIYSYQQGHFLDCDKKGIVLHVGLTDDSFLTFRFVCNSSIATNSIWRTAFPKLYIQHNPKINYYSNIINSLMWSLFKQVLRRCKSWQSQHPPT